MENTVTALESIVKEYPPYLFEITEESYAAKPNLNKWSSKEILGHLVDSAQNNIRRFIVSQYEQSPYIVYDQDKWVTICNYAAWTAPELIRLWILLNKQICFILKNTSPESKERLCLTNNANERSIEWLAQDYVKHLLHHLHQLLDMEDIPYP